jgi:hypothetical protein
LSNAAHFSSTSQEGQSITQKQANQHGNGDIPLAQPNRYQKQHQNQEGDPKAWTSP